MNEIAQFALGLGVFFVGMQMVGEHLRQLSGPSFRALVARFTASGWAGAALGLAAGAMMQSATGVTFILVNMVTSGLITAEAALPVIAWTNVGLTALAFVVSFDTHPLVAWSVGISGVAASLVRHRVTKQVANVLVGIALLLFGLQTMSGAAGPLEQAAWLQTLVSLTIASMPIAFLTGFLLAALLQSNTGATLLVITLASGGVFGLEPAVMLIYGTNLGAIVLRWLLAAGMRGPAVHLVRFEDLFCLLSGILMVTLFYIERETGIPLVLAVVKWVSPRVALQLAMTFLLSNLLPALVMWPLRGQAMALVSRLWPVAAEADPSAPKYLTTQSLADPVTAVDLIPRELARLLARLEASAHDSRVGAGSAELDDQQDDDFAALAARIDDFAGQLALASLQRSVAERLNVAREMISVVGYLVDSYAQLRHSLAILRPFSGTEQVCEQVLGAIDSLLTAAIRAVDTRQPDAISRLREQSRRHGELVEQTRAKCVRGAAADEVGKSAIAQRTAVLKVLGDFDLITWIVHRLSKLLEQFATPDAKVAER